MISVVEKNPVSSGKVLPVKWNNRLGWVDYARGLAIILVVYRHTMIGLKFSGIEVPAYLFNIQEFLLNIRMPIFFVLSGIFLGRSLETKSSFSLVKKKAATLLYPYVIWSAIMVTVQILLSSYTNSNRTSSDYLYIVIQPRELDHMWYLFALFNCSILYIALSRLMPRNFTLHIFIAVILCFFHFLVSEFSLLSDMTYYYIFLATGALFYKTILTYENKSSRFLLKLLLVILPIFVAGQLFWLYNINENYEPLRFWYRIPFLLIVLIGCVVFYCIARLLYNKGVLKWLNTIGRSSLYIYILHVLVIFSFRIISVKLLGIANVYFIIAGSLILGIIIPTFIYSFQRKWKVLHYFFSLEKKHQ